MTQPATNVLARFGTDPSLVALAFSEALTPFQCAVHIEVAQRPDFGSFVATKTRFEDDEYGGGPVTVTWYDTDGHLHAWRVGRKKVLQRADTRPK